MHQRQPGSATAVHLLVGRAPFVGKLAQAWPRTVALINSAAHPWYNLPLRSGAELSSDAYAMGPSKTALFPFAWGLQPDAAFAFSDAPVSVSSVVATTTRAHLSGGGGDASATAGAGGHRTGAGAGARAITVGADGNSTVTVTFAVQNTGTKRSAVTPQLYYSPPIAPRGLMRFPRRLVAFDKLWVGAGASIRGAALSFQLADGLGRWDEGRGGFVVDPGVYTLYLADCNINGVLDDARGCVQVSVCLFVSVNMTIHP